MSIEADACREAKGSTKGHGRHRAAGQKPCEECRQAQNARVSQYNLARSKARTRLNRMFPAVYQQVRSKLKGEGLSGGRLSYAVYKEMERLHPEIFFGLLDEEYDQAGLR